MKKIFSKIFTKDSVKEALHIYKLAFLFTGLIVIFVVLVLIPLFGTYRVNRWMLQSIIWSISSTKINYMQSMFQLGAATSIAFAIAGPQIQHALGPKVQGIIRYAKFKIRKSSNLAPKLTELINVLQEYDGYNQEYWALARGNLYNLHFIMASINLFLLIWSSLIDPRGVILNIVAFFVIMFSMFFPMIDLSRTHAEARHIRPILQEAKNACDSGIPDQIDAISEPVARLPGRG